MGLDFLRFGGYSPGVRSYAEFVSSFWMVGPGSLTCLPPSLRLRSFRQAYRIWLDGCRRCLPGGVAACHSVASLVDWFVAQFGPLPPREEPVLRERYWRLWDFTVGLHIRKSRRQARDGACILRRLHLGGVREPAGSWRPWKG